MAGIVHTKYIKCINFGTCGVSREALGAARVLRLCSSGPFLLCSSAWKIPRPQNCGWLEVTGICRRVILVPHCELPRTARRAGEAGEDRRWPSAVPVPRSSWAVPAAPGAGDAQCSRQHAPPRSQHASSAGSTGTQPGQRDQLLRWLSNPRIRDLQMLKAWPGSAAGAAAGSQALGGAGRVGSHLLAPVSGRTGQLPCGRAGDWAGPPWAAQQGNPWGLSHHPAARLEPGPAPTRGAAAHCKPPGSCAGSNSQARSPASRSLEFYYVFNKKKGTARQHPERHLPRGLLLRRWENCPLFFKNKSEGKPFISRQRSLGAAKDFTGITMNNSLSTEFHSKWSLRHGLKL